MNHRKPSEIMQYFPKIDSFPQEYRFDSSTKKVETDETPLSQGVVFWKLVFTIFTKQIT